MKTKKRKASSPSVLIVLIVAVALLISATFAAIFTETETVSQWFKVSNLKARSVVTFYGLTEEQSNTYKSDGYGYKVDVHNSNAANYIGKLNISVKYSGAGTGLVRVRMLEEWSTAVYNNGVETERTVQPHETGIPYIPSATFSGSGNQRAWYDNRANDYCYYYATPIYGTGSEYTIGLLEGGSVLDTTAMDLGQIPSGVNLHIIVEADVVQVNRYPQYWGLTSLPWSGAVSAAPDELVSTP